VEDSADEPASVPETEGRESSESEESEDRQDEEIEMGSARRFNWIERSLREDMYTALSAESAQNDYAYSFLAAFLHFLEDGDDGTFSYFIEEGGCDRYGFLTLQLDEDEKELRILNAGLLPIRASTVNLRALLEAVDELLQSRADCATTIDRVVIEMTAIRHFRGSGMQNRFASTALLEALQRRGYTGFVVPSGATSDDPLDAYASFEKQRNKA
jgi:hypothetical protein